MGGGKQTNPPVDQGSMISHKQSHVMDSLKDTCLKGEGGVGWLQQDYILHKIDVFQIFSIFKTAFVIQDRLICFSIIHESVPPMTGSQ